MEADAGWMDTQQTGNIESKWRFQQQTYLSSLFFREGSLFFGGRRGVWV
jgi:hypothetical protein